MTDPGSTQRAPTSNAQMIGHLVASFVGVFLTLLVDFGVPLTDAQQRDILTVVITGWGLASGCYALIHHSQSPVLPPSPGPDRAAAQVLPLPPGPGRSAGSGWGGNPQSPWAGGRTPARGTAQVPPPPNTWPPYDYGYRFPVNHPGLGGDQTRTGELPYQGGDERG